MVIPVKRFFEQISNEYGGVLLLQRLVGLCCTNVKALVSGLAQLTPPEKGKIRWGAS